MSGDAVHTYLLLCIGAVLAIGATVQEPGGTQMILAVTGFVAFFVGLLKMYLDERYALERNGAARSSRYLRPVGASLVFLSTVLPYLPLPLDRGATRTAYSFVDVVLAFASGAEAEGGLSIVIFASVIFAGAAASLLHYSGGYVVLFGVAGYGYVVSLLMEMSILSVFLTEFRSGMYVATMGAFLIIISSLVTEPPKKETGSDRSLIHESPMYDRRKPSR